MNDTKSEKGASGFNNADEHIKWLENRLDIMERGFENIKKRHEAIILAIPALRDDVDNALVNVMKVDTGMYACIGRVVTLLIEAKRDVTATAIHAEIARRKENRKEEVGEENLDKDLEYMEMSMALGAMHTIISKIS